MLKFEKTNEIEVYVSNSRQIVIKEIDDYGEEIMIALTLAQFSEIITNAHALISHAEELEVSHGLD